MSINPQTLTSSYSSRYKCDFLTPFSSIATLWSIEELKAYILFVQQRFKPKLSSSAQRILTRYYQYVRSHNRSVAQVTVRLLESLIRLAQAHARLMLRNLVQTMDAVVVVLLMEASVVGTGLLGGSLNESGT